jgi:hypothetical protein
MRLIVTILPLLQIVAEAENRAPKDAGLGEKSIARLTALSVPVPPESSGSRSGSVAPAPANPAQQQVLSACNVLSSAAAIFGYSSDPTRGQQEVLMVEWITNQCHRE